MLLSTEGKGIRSPLGPVGSVICAGGVSSRASGLAVYDWKCDALRYGGIDERLNS